MFAIVNMARSSLFAYQEFEWVLFVAMSVMVTRVTLRPIGAPAQPVPMPGSPPAAPWEQRGRLAQ
jgi:hypothetical protein